ncbi:ATP adenylyltransferase [Saitoella complicata NRRL Y-17804]|uniref:Uncharacterized protein n=1 Tax=Saitoella complicata (strain BCRC 22490 / CBS 7301 / JCM 7358 / NBRC 10748 / NRRL Y-17804) TaxID=698492 RepID=A0A0E9NKH7_SAICN|nr:ATP adenylyltransferase [Saitoella complicata NRRL Y-17804]ODQ50540.1 ATP adenylyltransferase [Saitoella complicata NRRL Y-17804]GAO50318.1 hypothetical protein G7K_4448-t1 [Saitoella complicata NRRL Y-17804]
MSTLEDLVKAKYDEALASGELVFTESSVGVVEENRVKYSIRCAPGLATKPEKKDIDKEKTDGKPFNPFLPPNPALFVQEMEPKHTVVLNKFCIVPRHFLLITKAYEDQTKPLNPADLEAIWKCFEGLRSKHMAFYNCGPASGASQGHKHVQFIPLPSADEFTPFPDDIVRAQSSNGPGLGQLLQHDAISFEHFILPIPRNPTPDDLAEIYVHLLSPTIQACRMADCKTISYNVCMTRDWMFMAPRVNEGWDGLSFNSTAMVGMLLVKSEVEMEKVKKEGPSNILAKVGVDKGQGNEDQSAAPDGGALAS